MSRVVERFLQYVQLDTKSVMPKPGQKLNHPSSSGQVDFRDQLIEELYSLGVKVYECADSSFLLHLPSTSDQFASAPRLVFAAHLDTYFGLDGRASPQEHVYQGGDLIVNADRGVIIPAKDLHGLVGETIITSDGTTLLGADDKAGVATMMDVIERLITENIPHGPIFFWFCVDEEIGELDISVIPKEVVSSWDILWTLDGERLGSVDVGCFICRKIDLVFTGVDAHPGVSGDKLKPAHYAAAVLVAEMATSSLTPMKTRGLEPFYYVTELEGGPSKATVTCMPRSFYSRESKALAAAVTGLAHRAALQFGVTVEVTDKILCHNTRQPIKARMQLVQPAINVLKERGIVAEIQDVRGGTDGAMVNMAYPELPAPNLGTGCSNLHGPQEFLVVRELEVLPLIIIDMIDCYSKMIR